MKLFISELQYLSELYSRMKAELSKSDVGSNINTDAELSRVILCNQELFARIEQMSSRLSQLSKEWENFREHMDAQPRKEICLFVQTVTKQAIQLKQLCADRAVKLEKFRDRLEETFCEIRKGTQYLNSVKPIKSNYPKFFDSRW
jgi:hypothetical protein